MDGIGGTIKKQVVHEVKSGRIVESAHDFSVYAKRIVETIAIIYLPNNNFNGGSNNCAHLLS